MGLGLLALGWLGLLEVGVFAEMLVEQLLHGAGDDDALAAGLRDQKTERNRAQQVGGRTADQPWKHVCHGPKCSRTGALLHPVRRKKIG